MDQPQRVFILQHAHELPGGCEDVKFIGAYSSRAHAEAAAARLRTQPGFRDTPEGFHIDDYTIDADHWAEGFVTLVGETEVPVRVADKSRPAG